MNHPTCPEKETAMPETATPTIATPQTAPAGTRVSRIAASTRTREFATVTGWIGRDVIGVRYDNGATYAGPTWGGFLVAEDED